MCIFIWHSMSLFIWHSISFSFSLGRPLGYMCKNKLVSQQEHNPITLQNLLGKLGLFGECLKFPSQHRCTCIVSLYWETKISIFQPSLSSLVLNFSREVTTDPLNFSRGVTTDPLKILALFACLPCLWPPQAKHCISVLVKGGIAYSRIFSNCYDRSSFVYFSISEYQILSTPCPYVHLVMPFISLGSPLGGIYKLTNLSYIGNKILWQWPLGKLRLFAFPGVYIPT